MRTGSDGIDEWPARCDAHRQKARAIDRLLLGFVQRGQLPEAALRIGLLSNESTTVAHDREIDILVESALQDPPNL